MTPEIHYLQPQRNAVIMKNAYLAQPKRAKVFQCFSDLIDLCSFVYECLASINWKQIMNQLQRTNEDKYAKTPPIRRPGHPP